MTRTDAALVCLPLLGIYLLAEGIASLPALLSAGYSAAAGAPTSLSLLGILFPAVGLSAIGLVLITRARPIAVRLFPVSDAPREAGDAIDRTACQAIGLSLIGIWRAAVGLPSFLSGMAFAIHRAVQPGGDDVATLMAFGSVNWVLLARDGLQIAVGAGLFLFAQPLAMLWRDLTPKRSAQLLRRGTVGVLLIALLIVVLLMLHAAP